jgi:hypothetical protein
MFVNSVLVIQAWLDKELGTTAVPQVNQIERGTPWNQGESSKARRGMAQLLTQVIVLTGRKSSQLSKLRPSALSSGVYRCGSLC